MSATMPSGYGVFKHLPQRLATRGCLTATPVAVPASALPEARCALGRVAERAVGSVVSKRIDLWIRRLSSGPAHVRRVYACSGWDKVSVPALGFEPGTN